MFIIGDGFRIRELVSDYQTGWARGERCFGAWTIAVIGDGVSDYIFLAWNFLFEPHEQPHKR